MTATRAANAAGADRVPRDRLDPRAFDRGARTWRGVGWDEVARDPARVGRGPARDGARRARATWPWSRCSREPRGCGSIRREWRSRARRCGYRLARDGWDGPATAGGSRSTAVRRCSAASCGRSPAPRSTRRCARCSQRGDPHGSERDRRDGDAGARAEAAGVLGRRPAAPGACRADRGPGARRGPALRDRVRGPRSAARGRRTRCAACSSAAPISPTWRCSSIPPTIQSSSGSSPRESRSRSPSIWRSTSAATSW